jgi:hypothetical protein
LLAALPLAALQANAAPKITQVNRNGATISFGADRDTLVFPGECVAVTWQVERVNALWLNDKSVVGSGQQEQCLADQNPALHLDFRDGTSRTYTLYIERLYRQPLAAVCWLIVIAALSSAAYSMLGARGLLVFLLLMVLGPMLRVTVNAGSNFIDHNNYAGMALIKGDLLGVLPPHFLYHLTVIALHSIIPGLDIENASFLLMLAAHAALALVVYTLLQYSIGSDAPPGTRRSLIVAGLTLALFLVAAIQVNPDGAYTAVIRLNTYYSPTLNLLKPLAAALFLCIIKCLCEPSPPIRLGITIALLVMLATLTKPSYTISILPAVGLILAVEVARRFLEKPASVFPLPSREKNIILYLLLPALLVLGYQYASFYISGQASVYKSLAYSANQPVKILFAPFELLTVWWHVPPARIIPDLIASILFPALVYGVYFQQARRDLMLNLAWLTFIIGQSYTYLLVENVQPSSGNLTWSGQITLLILFVAAVGFVLRQNTRWLSNAERSRLDWRFGLCALVFLLHLASGLIMLLAI